MAYDFLIIPMYATFRERIVPWIKCLVLTRNGFKTKDFQHGTWSTIDSILHEAVNLQDVTLQLPKPSSELSRNRFFLQLGALKRLEFLLIGSWDKEESAPNKWNAEDLFLLLEQRLTSLMGLGLSYWDLVPLPQSCLQPVPQRKIHFLAITNSFISREVIHQIIHCMSSMIVCSSGFIKDSFYIGRPHRHDVKFPTKPQPRQIFELSSNWLEGLQYQDILQVVLFHGWWLHYFKFSLRPRRRSRYIVFKLPLDTFFNLCPLRTLHLDGLHERSGIITPEFLQSFHCPLITELAIHHCYIPIFQVSAYLRRRRAAGLASKSVLDMTIRTFYNDETAQSASFSAIQDQFSDLQATIEAGAGKEPMNDDFLVVAHDFRFTFQEGGYELQRKK
ncbi:hypothetical protein BT69DRAFT_1285684 [Atractiella rhizophila]|nr:hypothetical protein BT69DRAFT_1285684 [Atractiella rhizophila]